MSTEQRTEHFVVLAEFTVKPGKLEEFLTFARDDARGSVNNEPGCQRFEALTGEEHPDTVVLVEVYDSRAAFEAHLQTPHYLKFAEGSEALTADKKVRFLARQVI